MLSFSLSLSLPHCVSTACCSNITGCIYLACILRTGMYKNQLFCCFIYLFFSHDLCFSLSLSLPHCVSTACCSNITGCIYFASILRTGMYKTSCFVVFLSPFLPLLLFVSISLSLCQYCMLFQYHCMFIFGVYIKNWNV